MKKLLKFLGAVFSFCTGLGFIVGAIEKKLGKVGRVEGHKPYGLYEKNVKRPVDFGLSLFALIILWPVMAVTAVLVRLKLGKPVLFKQQRPGLGGKIFTIRKFRTMRDGEGTDEERLTEFGKKLRSTSIDELPELINIVKGDMSVVGPRPLVPQYLPYYTEMEFHRHDVRPGLTGLAQVRGRNNLSWEDRFEWDIKYVNSISLKQDLTILIDTVRKVINQDDIVVRGTEGSVYDFDVDRKMKIEDHKE